MHAERILEQEDNPFYTRDFLFENGTLFLFRRGSLDRKVAYENIVGVCLRKGSYLKRPGLALLFGFGFLALPVWILPSVGVNPIGLSFLLLIFKFFRSGLFVAAIGIYMIYNGLPVHTIVEIKTSDGSVFRCPISTLVRKRSVEPFVAFLQNELGPSRVQTRRL
jgi:hypothetical protein